MRNICAITLIAVFGLLLAPTVASAQSECEYYRIKRGDTLKEISLAAYGTKDKFDMIFDENADEIGRNPNRIFPGTVLRIPCADGSFGKPEETAAKPTTSPENGTVSFVTANGYLPYTDESLRHRGFMSHLVTNAMLRAASDQDVEVVFVNDWAAHMDHLLPRQAFDASFPWTAPDCTNSASLSQSDRNACENFVYSNPFYEIVEGFFAKNGSGYENATAISAFSGTKICRPEGYPTGHILELGLSPANFTLVQPASVHECFEELMFGRVDLVALDTRSGERVMKDLGIRFDVTENPHLFSIQSLRVAAHKDNPNTNQLIETLNIGLAIMIESGEWKDIVTEGLASQARSQAHAANE